MESLAVPREAARRCSACLACGLAAAAKPGSLRLCPSSTCIAGTGTPGMPNALSGLSQHCGRIAGWAAPSCGGPPPPPPAPAGAARRPGSGARAAAAPPRCPPGTARCPTRTARSAAPRPAQGEWWVGRASRQGSRGRADATMTGPGHRLRCPRLPRARPSPLAGAPTCSPLSSPARSSADSRSVPARRSAWSSTSQQGPRWPTAPAGQAGVQGAASGEQTVQRSKGAGRGRAGRQGPRSRSPPRSGAASKQPISSRLRAGSAVRPPALRAAHPAARA